MVRRSFPDFVDRVEYWAVEDVGLCRTDIALDDIERRVRELHARLR
jgi:hypothetical protein